MSKTCHFEKDKKDFYVFLHILCKQNQRVKRTLSFCQQQDQCTSCTKGDYKSKPQVFKFCDFTKGGTDVVDQMNDYLTNRAKSLRWVMIVLYYLLDLAHVNAKTIWCIKNGIDHHKLKSYYFGWDLAKTLTVPHVICRDVNGLDLMIQPKRNLFFDTAFVVPEPKPKIKKRFECTAKRKKCVIHQANCKTKQEKDNCPRSTDQCQSCRGSICREHSLHLCMECLE